ncbi:hypothetical protein HBF26_06255 [Luteibacter jiangsuensis]|uniref:Secreted protein n=1 Tax=Luteibacter jiangsuensis TaxID=637577 RepID=A0ABX0Q1U4_9GAMM|nr:hypothetical protein [Luteibacter jiangsuensis]NID04479.1 hypothetical protein [Luteibacter jiangsuensis]
MRNTTRTLLASFVAVALGIGAAHAQTAMSGLGQSWPNATDVSTSPRYHVYVFERSGTRYIQVNDASGAVRGAFARTPYRLTGLPIGTDSLATPDERLPAPVSTAVEPVYDDGTVMVFVAPQPDGTARLMAVPADCKNDPVECTGR